MMRKNKNCSWVISVGLVIVFVMAGCATLNQENVAKGKFFIKLSLDHQDSSIPLEEHCYVVNLAEYTRIATIDGKKAIAGLGVTRSANTSIHRGDIVILPPGKHSFSLLYERDTSLNSWWEAKGDITADLKAGNYYFMHLLTNGLNIVFQLDNLEERSSIDMYGYTINSSANIPVASVIEGINAKIASYSNGFKGGIK